MKPLDPEQRKTREDWLKFLNPESLKASLLLASLYLSAYEILRSSIIEQIKSFFTLGWSEAEGDKVDPRYDREVLSLNKSPLYASAMWLKERGVIDSADIKKLDAIREHRNAIAHDLPAFVASSDTNVDVGLFQDICSLVSKIDRWWIMEVEIAIDEDLAQKEIDPSRIHSGNMVFLHLLVTIATGKAEDAAYYHNELKKHWQMNAEKNNHDRISTPAD